MQISPRNALTKTLQAGAAVAVVGASGLGWRLHDIGMIGGEGAPWEPWRAFEGMPSGDPLSLVGAGVLAASPHNTQPWRFEVAPNRIDLHAVADRNLGSFDPYRREMWLGLGCAVENMVQAAGAKGFRTRSVVAMPSDGVGGDAGGDMGNNTGNDTGNDRDGHAARLEILRDPAATPSRLGAFITARRTNRGDYLRDRPVAAPVLERLTSLSSNAQTRLMLFPAPSALGRAFAQGSIDATRWITADRTMSHDSQRWFRADPRAVAAHRDGVSVPTAGLDPWLATAAQLLPAPGTEAADRYWLDSVHRQMATAPWFGLLAVRELHDRRQQIEAGRLWQRVQLEMTAAGLASQPMNQMVEVVDRERQLGSTEAMARHVARWTGADWHATFFFRLGHPTRQVPQSARRAVAEVTTQVAADVTSQVTGQITRRSCRRRG